jgi:hypothetical protein
MAQTPAVALSSPPGPQRHASPAYNVLGGAWSCASQAAVRLTMRQACSMALQLEHSWVKLCIEGMRVLMTT